MANIMITQCDQGSVILENGEFRDELITFPGADTYAEGTILARKSVADAVTATAGGSNTGNGTVTLATVAAGSVVPLVGDYNFECTTAVTNGGIFKLEDPNGSLVASDIVLTAGAGATTVVEAAGLTFTVTDGSTDFAAGDSFALTVAADGKMVIFASAGAGGAQIPMAALTYEVEATGAGDVAARVMISGKVRKERLVIDADGDDTNVTAAVIDQLRDYGIVAVNVTELNKYDNEL